MKEPSILEVTLRDGSYVNNFSFTAADTAILCRELESAGIEYIEIGHGVGLNASNAGYGKAIQSDEEYMAAASGSLRKAKYGMFCIPGIARLEDLDLAHSYGMGFVRIGTNVTEVQQSEHFIKRAKKHGMFVAANYMKSYALPPEEFAKQVELSVAYGADMVYIVDSAGGMFKQDVERYYRAIRGISDIPVGFHGHDNLGLANANSLQAAETGFEFIDASLQGLGRSAGNACTEALIAALLKRGFDMKVDLLKLFDIGQRYIQQILQVRGRMPLDITSGYAEFHSAYMPHIQRCAAKYNINPLILIIEICKIDKVNLHSDVLDSVARRISSDGEHSMIKYGFERYIGGEQDDKK